MVRIDADGQAEPVLLRAISVLSWLAVLGLGISLSMAFTNPPGVSAGGWLRQLAPFLACAVILSLLVTHQRGVINLAMGAAHFPAWKLGFMLLAGIGSGVLGMALRGMELLYFAVLLLLVGGAVVAMALVVRGRTLAGIAAFLLVLPFVGFFETSYPPIVYASLDIGPLVFTPVIALTILLLLAWLVRSLLSGEAIQAGPIGRALGFYLLVTLISTFLSGDILASQRRFFFSLLVPGVMFFVFSSCTSKPKGVEMVLRAGVGSCALSSAFAIYLYLKNPALSFQALLSAADLFREGVPYITTFAQIVSMSIPLSLMAFLLEGRPLWRAGFAFATVITVLMLVLSLSRTNLIGMAIAVSVFLIPHRKARWVLVMAGVLVFLLWSHVGIVHYLLSAKWEMAGGVNQLSAYSNMGTRLESYKAAWGMFRDHPLCGVGLGLYQDRFPLYGPPLLYSGATRWDVPYYMFQAHNWWVNTAAEAGFLGLLGLLVFTFAVVRESVLAWKNARDPREQLLVHAIVGSLVAFAIANFGDTVALGLLKRITPGILLVCVLGCLAIIRRNQTERKAHD